MSAVIVIPARYASSRFPGKPLVMLNGTSLIQRCYESAIKVPGVTAVYVATDDARIEEHVKAFGGRVLMTSEHCANGTERCAAALDVMDMVPDIVINWQGDSPLIPAGYVTALIAKLKASPEVELVTPVLRCDSAMFKLLKSERAAGRVGGVSVVTTHSGRALYFTRELVPWADKLGEVGAEAIYMHVGMYGYRPDVLRRYPTWQIGPLERIESLEQLRFLENDRVVAAVEVPGEGHWEVNFPEDVPIVESLLKKHGIA